MKNIAGAVAFITGGSTGLGLGIARALIESEAKVVVSYRRAESIYEAMDSFTRAERRRIHAIQLDVTDRKAVAVAADEAERAFGKIHILCNNAGAIMFCPLQDATYDDWDWILDVNVNATFSCLKHVVPRIRRHGEGGQVVNIASMSAFIPGPNVGIYTASKFAVRGLTECLRFDLAQYDIGVSLLCPGLVRTRIHECAERRPAYQATADFADADFRQKVKHAFEVGMEPLDVGRHVVAGIRENRAYIFSHLEFRDELSENFAGILSAMPVGNESSPRRAVEDARRRNTLAAQHRAAAIR